MPQLLVFTLLDLPQHLKLTASASGRLLVFEHAILARAEINRNKDEITEQGVRELAASIVNMPIDYEHDFNFNIGSFTSGQPLNDPQLGWVVDVSGFIWAQRFPKIAADVMSGKLGLSIEADAARATCRNCGKTFTAGGQYCQHLINQFKSGAVRLMEGLTAVGGGAVHDPAGSHTDFTNSRLHYVASRDRSALEAHAMKICPFCGKDPEGEAECAKCHKSLSQASLAAALSEALPKLNTLETEKSNALQASQTVATQLETAKQNIVNLQADKTRLEGEVSTATSASSELKTKLETTEVELTAAKQKVSELETQAATLRASMRRAAIGERMTDAEWEKNKAVYMAMDEAAFAASLKLAGITFVAGIRLDADPPVTSDKSGDKYEIVL